MRSRPLGVRLSAPPQLTGISAGVHIVNEKAARPIGATVAQVRRRMPWRRGLVLTIGCVPVNENHSQYRRQFALLPRRQVKSRTNVISIVSIVCVAIFMGAQFVRYPRINLPVSGELAAPAPVKEVLETSCYDCHSDRTRWPWYSRVAPVSWWVQYEVTEGRRRLNFSDWAAYASDPGTEKNKLEQIASRIERGDMAPWYYRLMHPRARLTPLQRETIMSWISQTSATDAQADSNPAASVRSSERK